MFSEREWTPIEYINALFYAVAFSSSPTEIIGVSMLIAKYFWLAAMMASVAVETVEPFVSWEVQPTERRCRIAVR